MNVIEVICPHCGKTIEYQGKPRCPSCRMFFDSNEAAAFKKLLDEANSGTAGNGQKTAPTGNPSQQNKNGSDAQIPKAGQADKAVPLKSEPSIAEPSNVEPSIAEPPKIESPKAETPITETPKTEPEKAEPPIAETPKTETPKKVVQKSKTKLPVNNERRFVRPNEKSRNVVFRFSLSDSYDIDFYEGSEFDACIYILENELKAAVIDSRGRATPAFDTLAKHMRCESVLSEVRNEGRFTFYYVIYRCLLSPEFIGKLSAVGVYKSIPLYYKGKIIAQTQIDLREKICERIVPPSILKELYEERLLEAYLGIDSSETAESALMKVLSNETAGYYHVDESFNVKRIALARHELFLPQNFLYKYDIAKALRIPACTGYIDKTQEPSFYDSFSAAIAEYGCVDRNEYHKLLFLKSVEFNMNGFMRFMDERFSKENLKAEVYRLIMRSVETDIKFFYILRVLLKAKVFGAVGTYLLGEELYNKIIGSSDAVTALKDAYYFIKDKSVKRIFFKNAFHDLRSVACLIASNTTADSALRGDDLIEGIKCVYGKDVSAIVRECDTKVSNAIAECQRSFTY